MSRSRKKRKRVAPPIQANPPVKAPLNTTLYMFLICLLVGCLLSLLLGVVFIYYSTILDDLPNLLKKPSAAEVALVVIAGIAELALAGLRIVSFVFVIKRDLRFRIWYTAVIPFSILIGVLFCIGLPSYLGLLIPQTLIQIACCITIWRSRLVRYAFHLPYKR